MLNNDITTNDEPSDKSLEIIFYDLQFVFHALQGYLKIRYEQLDDEIDREDYKLLSSISFHFCQYLDDLYRAIPEKKEH